MAVLTAPKSMLPNSHWYDITGKSHHETPKSDGKGMRPTTLGDARKIGLFPSVTGILSIFAKPQLEMWKMREVIKAQERTKRTAGEPIERYADRCIEESHVQVEEAADLGTKNHAEIERWVQWTRNPSHPFEWSDETDGRPTEQYPNGTPIHVYVGPCIAWLASLGAKFSHPECRVVNVLHGFAGTMDLPLEINGKLGTFDFKSRKTKNDEDGKPVEVKAYDFQDMQIAAYHGTYWGERTLLNGFGANVFISSTQPGRFDVVRYTGLELAQAWDDFLKAVALWRHIKGYDCRPKAVICVPEENQFAPMETPVPPRPEASEPVVTPPAAQEAPPEEKPPAVPAKRKVINVIAGKNGEAFKELTFKPHTALEAGKLSAMLISGDYFETGKPEVYGRVDAVALDEKGFLTVKIALGEGGMQLDSNLIASDVYYEAVFLGHEAAKPEKLKMKKGPTPTPMAKGHAPKLVADVEKPPKPESAQSKAKRLPTAGERVPDDTKMPFGKHKNKKLGDLPASYFLYLRDWDGIESWPLIKTYIEQNEKSFEKECSK